MAKNLLIVESPAKAKTIEKFLGSDFEVKSCYGHIRDLEKNDMGVDINNNFSPRYVIPEDKEKVVRELRSIAKKSNEIWLASDEDREGESISWHLAEVLNLNPQTTKRIVFHEITKPAIQKAVANPRVINMNLVNAQQARRVLDRIVGFELSPVLWRKIGRAGGLSAGRVQSVAVRLIVEKEREINHHVSESSFVVKAIFTAKDINDHEVSFGAEGAKFKTQSDAEIFLKSCVGAAYKVNDIQVKPGRKSPSAPFTTSTLQQEASRKLGYSVSKTMLIAQRLYENGNITYMRTDSVNLSHTAIEEISEAIEKNYGGKYLQHRKYKNKNESAQEAHEAIRPTYMSKQTIEDADGKKLYELIWKRTIASQMSDAQLERTIAKVGISTNKEELTASGEVIKFDGFLKVYAEGMDDDDAYEDTDGRLPNLIKGQMLHFIEMKAIEKFSRPPARYTEASLVKKMEELGIGRPSTYAPTISTILKRNYVEKKDREGAKRDVRILQLKDDCITKLTEQEISGTEKAKLFPTDLGNVVTDFLSKHFDNVMDYGFTASIEEEFDKIAAGKEVWNKMVGNFYTPFHKEVAETMETAERATGEKFLGNHPETGKPVIARMGKFGAMVQIGSTDGENDKPQFASLRAGQSIETITLEEALDLFKLPFSLGTYDEKELIVGIGRFGPYLKYGDEYISLPKDQDPLKVDKERAMEIIAEKQKSDAPIATFNGLPVTKGKGRFGPFIKWNNLYVNVPRAYHFDQLTQKDCEELIAKKIEKEANRFIQQWPDEKISIENGRWGPFLRFGKKMLKLGRPGKSKYTAEEATLLSLEEVKEMIMAQIPGAFDKKAPRTKKSAKDASATRKSKSKTK